MVRIAEPYTIIERGKTFQFTLNSNCGLPGKVCNEWKRKSFQSLPDELAQFRNPKSKPAARASASALLLYKR